MNSYSFSKQGFVFRIIYAFMQVLVFLPVSFILSEVISYCICSYSERINHNFAFRLAFFIINLLWVLRNSFIVLNDDTILLRDVIGRKKTIDVKDVSNIRIIESSECNKLILSKAESKSIVSNCSLFINPKSKLVSFEDNQGRTVIIGTWNINGLKELLSENEVNTECRNNNEINGKLSGKKVYYLKMTFSDYVKWFALNFLSTLVMPAFIALVFILLTNGRMNNAAIGIMALLFFVIASLMAFFKALKVVLDKGNLCLTMDSYVKSNKDYISLKGIKNVEIVNDEMILKHQNDFKDITFVYGARNNLNDAVYFETDYLKVIISTNDISFYNELLSLSNT